MVINLDGNIFETQVELGLILKLKGILKVIPNVISQSAVDLVKKYNIETSFSFPKFINWSTNNYVVENRVLMNSNASRVLCNINPQSIRRALHLPESNLEESLPFNEENLIRSFRQTKNDVKLGFMSRLLKLDQVSENLSFWYDLQVFQDSIEPFFALLSQVLGLDSDKQVQEVMVSLAYKLSQFEFVSQEINFDEFLAESIHS